ncbi:MAG: RraA family protein [SAR202 cluster bacterium]|nr:RraA family protein [SAR202 cluster bacterium]|tara:strand:+ start:873 stop:1529 length:657 start_codon:yes stop_codon:yes gene_type:complete
MITVNPHPSMVPSSLIEAYQKIPAANLGHFLDTALDPGIQALFRPIKLVGTALTVQTTQDNMSAIRKAVEIAQPGDVLVIDRAGEMRHAVMGDYGVHGWIEKGIAGMVVDGLVTDRDGLERLKFPVFSRGVVAQLPKGQGPVAGGVNVPVVVGSVTVNPGDLVLGDENGVIVASVKDAEAQLEAAIELGQWEVWALAQVANGRPFAEVAKDRKVWKDR